MVEPESRHRTRVRLILACKWHFSEVISVHTVDPAAASGRNVASTVYFPARFLIQHTGLRLRISPCSRPPFTYTIGGRDRHHADRGGPGGPGRPTLEAQGQVTWPPQSLRTYPSHGACGYCTAASASL